MAICKGEHGPRRSPRHIGSKGSRVSASSDDDAEEPLVKRQLVVNAIGKALQSDSWQSSMESFTVKGPQLKAFMKQFALYIITSETPFQRVNNKYLREAGRIVGMNIPDEKVFRTRMLDELFAETQEVVARDMMKLLKVRKQST